MLPDLSWKRRLEQPNQLHDFRKSGRIVDEGRLVLRPPGCREMGKALMELHVHFSFPNWRGVHGRREDRRKTGQHPEVFRTAVVFVWLTVEEMKKNTE